MTTGMLQRWDEVELPRSRARVQGLIDGLDDEALATLVATFLEERVLALVDATAGLTQSARSRVFAALANDQLRAAWDRLAPIPVRLGSNAPDDFISTSLRLETRQ